MQGRTIIRHAIDAIGRISRFFSPTESVVRQNSVLAKWDQYYEAHPSNFTRQTRDRTLIYLRTTD